MQRRVLIVSTVIALLSTGSLFAQTAQITGRVADTSGAVVPGTAIVVTNDISAFETMYGFGTVGIAGQFSGLLDNAGERVVLAGKAGRFDLLHRLG